MKTNGLNAWRDARAEVRAAAARGKVGNNTGWAIYVMSY